MSGETPGHRGEDGAPCAAHAEARLDALMSLALVGSRTPSFNHDIASKLQGLMMTLDELGELIEARGSVEREVTEAMTAASAVVTELTELLAANRALTRPQARARQTVRELLARSGERVGVALRGLADGDAEVHVSVHAVTHALTLALDVAAGPTRGRTIDATCRRVDGRVELVVPVTAPGPALASEYLAIADAVLQRDGGELRCGADRLVIRLPLAP